MDICKDCGKPIYWEDPGLWYHRDQADVLHCPAAGRIEPAEVKV